MQIRELTSTDAAEFQALRLQALLDSPSAFSSSHAEECNRELAVVAERISATPEHCVLGAFVDSQLIGMLGLQRERPEKLAHKAFVWGMFVAPSYRQAGIGRALLSGALTRAAGMTGIRQINLGVNANNLAALALYERCGFKPFGTERGFMLLNGVLHDEILMVHRLAVT